jgi:hypothetical protein
VEAEAFHPASANGRSEDAVPEVVVVQHLAARRREDEPTVVRFSGEELSPQDARRGAREVDATARGAGLYWHEFTLICAVVDLDGHCLEVDIAIAEGEQLALPESGERGEQDEVAVGRDSVRGELLDLRPVEPLCASCMGCFEEMKIRNRDEGQRQDRGGQVSHLLFAPNSVASAAEDYRDTYSNPSAETGVVPELFEVLRRRRRKSRSAVLVARRIAES